MAAVGVHSHRTLLPSKGSSTSASSVRDVAPVPCPRERPSSLESPLALRSCFSPDLYLEHPRCGKPLWDAARTHTPLVTRRGGAVLHRLALAIALGPSDWREEMARPWPCHATPCADGLPSDSHFARSFRRANLLWAGHTC